MNLTPDSEFSFSLLLKLGGNDLKSILGCDIYADL